MSFACSGLNRLYRKAGSRQDTAKQVIEPPNDSPLLRFAWKDTDSSTVTNARTNFLRDYWFYVPTSTNPAIVQALESDLFIALPIGSETYEFMFDAQCDVNGTSPADYWQFAWPRESDWTATNFSCQPPFGSTNLPCGT